MAYKNTSWEKESKKYNELVSDKGHYYHEQVVIPGAIRLLQLDKKSAVLDLGCGQGILAKQLSQDISYTGIDLSKSLINFAIQKDRNPKHNYVVADATRSYNIASNFTHAAAILSFQNMENQQGAVEEAGRHLEKHARFVIVLNHPAFRIPRQSGWGVSENKQQYRYVTRYLTPLKIPIQMHPGDKESVVTWSFHYPLSYYFNFLQKAGFVVETLEEWTSDKESAGKAAKMENRARSEIPLFLAIVARKK